MFKTTAQQQTARARERTGGNVCSDMQLERGDIFLPLCYLRCVGPVPSIVVLGCCQNVGKKVSSSDSLLVGVVAAAPAAAAGGGGC